MKEGVITAPEVSLANKQEIIDVGGQVSAISGQPKNASSEQPKARKIFVANMNA